MPGTTNDQIMQDSTEEESKVDIEEASVNLNYVKNEPTEDNLHVTQYRVTVKNIIGGNFKEYDDNLIGFLESDAIMENVVIKLEGIKQEDGNFHYCNECNGDYKGHCLKCSTLSQILNNTLQHAKPESEINTMPMDIVEIKDTSGGKGIFLLKTLPRNIIFGPFVGISAVKIAERHGWKINNKKLESTENGNWMKDIACATSASIKNLDVFQLKGNLYFQTNREIMEGEELFVYYDDEEVQKLDDNQECYFIPQKKENLPKIFVCTPCCLGFQLVKCLMEHKNKCPHREHNTDFKDFELVECHCCKIWLGKKEHQEYHMDYCREKYLGMSFGHSQPVDRNEVIIEETKDHLNTKAVHGVFKSPQSFYEIDYERNLRKHLITHKKRPYQCDVCMAKFIRKVSLKMHVKNKHAENGSVKDYTCTECPYETNYREYFQIHLNKHRSIKPFECGICKMKFIRKVNLKMHVKNKHAENEGAKDYKCSECSYETNYKHNFQIHLNKHRSVKPFECSICKMKYNTKNGIKKHMKNKHIKNGCTKDYQCMECTYQTNDKCRYQIHLNRHRDIKPFTCDVCKMNFISKGHLSTHIKNKHIENGNVKNYQCPSCSHQTNNKHNFQVHLNTHKGIKPFQCNICLTKFTVKDSLNMHIKNKHAEDGSTKDYQCSECSYQTNYKWDYQIHVNVHNGVKPFECGICKMKFTMKRSLKWHTKDKHRENGIAKDYQCSDCSYQTNSKRSYQSHSNRHRGIKPFECGICKMRYTSRTGLNTHVKNKHIENGYTNVPKLSETSKTTPFECVRINLL